MFGRAYIYDPQIKKFPAMAPNIVVYLGKKMKRIPFICESEIKLQTKRDNG
jgi:hypothetical protein